MNATVADACLATNLAVPNVKARLSPSVQPVVGSLITEDHVVRLSSLHPDERLGYLENIGFTAEELATVSELVENWLNVPQRSSLDKASRDACRAGEGLDVIMESWSRTGPYEALATSINQSGISQPEPAICTATELAWSMLIVHEFDSDRKPITGGPDAMWAEQDQEIAALGLQEDIALWPE